MNINRHEGLVVVVVVEAVYLMFIMQNVGGNECL